MEFADAAVLAGHGYPGPAPVTTGDNAAVDPTAPRTTASKLADTPAIDDEDLFLGDEGDHDNDNDDNDNHVEADDEEDEDEDDDDGDDDFDEDYFSSTYRPLSNLPTPPPSSHTSSLAQSPYAGAHAHGHAHGYAHGYAHGHAHGPSTAPDASDSPLLGPAVHLVNLLPPAASLATPSVALVQAMLARAALPLDTVALAVCILDSLDSRFARAWRLTCPLTPPAAPPTAPPTALSSSTRSPPPSLAVLEKTAHPALPADADLSHVHTNARLAHFARFAHLGRCPRRPPHRRRLPRSDCPGRTRDCRQVYRRRLCQPAAGAGLLHGVGRDAAASTIVDVVVIVAVIVAVARGRIVVVPAWPLPVDRRAARRDRALHHAEPRLPDPAAARRRPAGGRQGGHAARGRARRAGQAGVGCAAVVGRGLAIVRQAGNAHQKDGDGPHDTPRRGRGRGRGGREARRRERDRERDRQRREPRCGRGHEQGHLAQLPEQHAAACLVAVRDSGAVLWL
ncbi:uncharacterized protein SPSK_00783 [Sporothrix schenckii 1099-18]|uniref:Uncharacterized protein n=1 Tax=Sporothrix schenckii 1099-18 TaxID=1397361 RepID=A0A0F2LWI6_SPOSC|nr:uncharacterized protein SPSK_00783 [Sporothrix schenckii 1099-18]KJR81818.1 hypothetical protein SPSK_00783 [Sporothrix schenckii 1099-18]